MGMLMISLIQHKKALAVGSVRYYISQLRQTILYDPTALVSMGFRPSSHSWREEDERLVFGWRAGIRPGFPRLRILEQGSPYKSLPRTTGSWDTSPDQSL
jgi:hypothetical protein